MFLRRKFIGCILDQRYVESDMMPLNELQKSFNDGLELSAKILGWTGWGKHGERFIGDKPKEV